MKNVTKSERIAIDMLAEIRRERMEPGDRLPTEQELGDRYGVSRSVIREATRTLVTRGIVEVGSGRGLSVTAVGGDVASEQLMLYLEARFDGGYRSVHEVREVLEIQAARFAAERAERPDLTALEESHAKMIAASTEGLETISKADIEFHRQIAIATGNEIFVVLLDAIAPTLNEPRVKNLVTAAGREEAITGHREILDAIAEGDAERAAAAMKGHLDKVIARLSTTAEGESTDAG